VQECSCDDASPPRRYFYTHSEADADVHGCPHRVHQACAVDVVEEAL